jgi:hypothetical protein
MGRRLDRPSRPRPEKGRASSLSRPPSPRLPR